MNFPYQPLFYLPRHRFAEKSAVEMDKLLQKLVELTGTDPGPQQQPQMSPGVYQILNPFFYLQ